jgi:hypothetical protein
MGRGRSSQRPGRYPVENGAHKLLSKPSIGRCRLRAVRKHQPMQSTCLEPDMHHGLCRYSAISLQTSTMREQVLSHNSAAQASASATLPAPSAAISAANACSKP